MPNFITTLEAAKVRECVNCTALIANDVRFGRKASKAVADVCEVCEAANDAAWAKLQDVDYDASMYECPEREE